MSGEPELNFVSRKGSVTSVKTLTVGSNCSLVDYEKEIDGVKNKIQVLGYGSGINQIKSDIKEDATSQSAYGVREYTRTDKAITTKATADAYAAKLLSFYKDPVIRISVEAPYSGNESIVSGDNVTLVSPGNGINSVFRVFGIRRIFGMKGDKVVYNLSSKQYDLAEFLAESTNKVDENSEYSNGATIRQGEDFIVQASATSGYPDEENGYIRFTSPSGGTTTVNEAVLNLNVVKFRVPVASGSVGNGATSNFSLNDTNTTSASTTSAGGASVLSSNSSSNTYATGIASGSWVTLINLGTDGAASSTSKVEVYGNVFASSSLNGVTPCDIRLAITSGSTTNYYPSSSGVTCLFDTPTSGASGMAGFYLTAPVTTANKNITVEIKPSLAMTYVLTYAYYMTIGLHSHTSAHPSASYSTGSNNIAHNDHSWTYTSGISADSLPGISYNVYVGESSAAPEDDETETWQNAATLIGSSLSAKEVSINISDSLSLSPDTRYTIKIKPTASIEFQANVQTTHFNDDTEL